MPTRKSAPKLGLATWKLSGPRDAEEVDEMAPTEREPKREEYPNESRLPDNSS